MKKFRTVRFDFALVIYTLLAILAPQMAWAVSLNPSDGLEEPVSLNGHLAVFYDPTGSLTIDDVSSGPEALQFNRVSSMLTEGYRAGAVWVRFSLSAPRAVGNRWLLKVERPLIENVTVYVPDRNKRFSVSQPTSFYGWQQRYARTYPSLFPISVTPEPNVYYVRFQSKTSITSSINIWQEKGYQKFRRFDQWIIAAVIGAIGAMIFANLLHAGWLGDTLYVVYAGVLVESGLMAIYHLGYAAEILQFLSRDEIYRSWGVIVCMYSAVMVEFLLRVFELQKHWALAWWVFRIVVLANCVAAFIAALGNYDYVAYLVSSLQMIAYIVIALIVLYLLLWRRKYQYILPAAAFAGVIVVSLIMQLQYTGNNLLMVGSSLGRILAVGTLVHLVLFSAAVAKRAQLAERGFRKERERVLALSQASERDLIVKVRERTAELADSNVSLKNEIERRRRLELKLRGALDTINDALTRQRNFLALVTHEFRAPLSVISVAAENLLLLQSENANNIRVRATRIRRTVKRMSFLLDNVLADDQLSGSRAQSDTIDVFDLNEILGAVKAGLDDDAIHRVGFRLDKSVMVRANRILLEIALQNLIQNALKYSPERSHVNVHLTTNENMAFVDVMDRGTGVSPDDRERIFMKYVRTTGQTVGGSGLGLYISRQIARQYGGDVMLVESDADGSTFRLSLPAMS